MTTLSTPRLTSADCMYGASKKERFHVPESTSGPMSGISLAGGTDGWGGEEGVPGRIE